MLYLPIMNKAAIIIAVSMLASRVLGIFREMLLARAAGVSTEKNALDLAFMIPDILNHVVSTGFLSIIFIPIFTGYLVQKKEEAAWRFFSNILNTLGLFLLFLILCFQLLEWLLTLNDLDYCIYAFHFCQLKTNFLFYLILFLINQIAHKRLHTKGRFLAF